MNKLEIARMVNTLAGTQGQVDTTESATGYQATLVTFIDNSYKDIQTYRENWKFLQKNVTVPLTALVSTYTDTDIAKVRYVIYNKTKLTEVDYEEWILNDWQSGSPRYYTINPADGVITFNDLDGAYNVELYYQAVPDVMSLNTDEPLIPTRFQQAIVYKALIDLGGYLGNYDLIQMYSNKYNYELGELMRNQIPSSRVRTQPFVANSRWYV